MDILKDLKYLFAYTVPAVTYLSLQFPEGWWSYGAVIYAFGVIPLVEIFVRSADENLTPEQIDTRKTQWFFDVLLYVNPFLVFALVAFGFYQWQTLSLTTAEQIGMILSLGICLGTNGINVAHELGHRKSRGERTLAKLLLLPSLYMHFYIEHNFGHHRNVATPADPASAPFGKTVYEFWLRSVLGQYINAWKLQHQLLSNRKNSWFSIQNDMLFYLIFQTIYLWLIFTVFGLSGLIFGASIALVSILLLETINYIEHYGLARIQKPSGRYERVLPQHSWNSNHLIGRIVLYELTRHSDHHFLATKKYQILENHTNSPQLPFGYPTAMLTAMVPPLWFWIMNPMVPQEMRLT
ncbi:MAG: alkane 1-monooxygenase [Flavobacteriaceae bacterium]